MSSRRRRSCRCRHEVEVDVVHGSGIEVGVDHAGAMFKNGDDSRQRLHQRGRCRWLDDARVSSAAVNHKHLAAACG